VHFSNNSLLSKLKQSFNPPRFDLNIANQDPDCNWAINHNAKKEKAQSSVKVKEKEKENVKINPNIKTNTDFKGSLHLTDK